MALSFPGDAQAYADYLTHRTLKQLEVLEEKEDAPSAASLAHVSLYSPTSSHLSHALLSSSHVSTLSHLESLFSLDPASHSLCPCHWCLTSPYHRHARVHRRRRPFVTMVAPMVRYSHLPFRLLCRHYGADVAFTPMIIAAGFNRSQAARDADFQTSAHDTPLIVQFGCDNPNDLQLAAARALPYVRGIDLNCQ